MHDLAKGDVMFAATGVTDGSMLRGVRRFADGADHPLDRDALEDRHGALRSRRTTTSRSKTGLPSWRLAGSA